MFGFERRRIRAVHWFPSVGHAEAFAADPGLKYAMARAGVSAPPRIEIVVEGAVGAACRRYGLSHAALNALAVIEGEGKPMLTGEVAVRMHVTSGTVTSLLDNLERKGYVARSNDPDDRRRVLVDITPTAQEVLDATLPAVQQVAHELFDDIGIQNQKALLGILDEIRHAVANLPGDLPDPLPRKRPEHLTR